MPAPTVRERGPNRHGRRRCARGASEPELGLAIRRLGLVGLASQIQQSPMATRLRPTSALARSPEPGSDASARARKHFRCRQHFLGPANQTGQRGHLKVRARHAKPRGRVRFLAEECPELAVEFRRRIQEPVAQLLELVLLEQEVLADASVEPSTASTARS